MYDTKIKGVTSHMLFTPPTPLQTVTPSRTPSLERDIFYGRPLKYLKQLISVLQFLWCLPYICYYFTNNNHCLYNISF